MPKIIPAPVPETAANPLQKANALSFSHMGFYVRDLPRMARFYKEALGFTQTDQGNLGPVQLVFLSRDPNEHHQLVLASGRPAESNPPGFNVINQVSLREPIDLDQSDEAIMARAEAIARSRPQFQPREVWQAELARKMNCR